MIHLSEIANAHKLRDWYLCERAFRGGAIYFVVDGDGDYLSAKSSEGEVVDYGDFIANPDVFKEELPIEIVEVTGCDGCPMYTKISQHDYQYCSYPDKQKSCQMHVDMFATCPLKTKSITIKNKTIG